MASHLISNLKYGLAISLALMAPRLAHADTLTLDTWSNASINGYAISGSFVYDATNNSIVSDSTTISGLCSFPACGLVVFQHPGSPTLVVTPTGPLGSPKYIAFYNNLGVPGTFSGLYAAWDMTFNNELPEIFGGVNITAAPAPTPSEGLLSVALILIMGLSARFRGLIV
jgi:hypothetical protein